MTWETIKGAGGRVVYYRRQLGDGSYLAVTARDGGWWNWDHRGPQFGLGGYRLNATGDTPVRTAATAKRHADKHIQEASR